MRQRLHHAVATLLGLASLTMLAPATHAASADRCIWSPRSVAATRAADESRVADWIVGRILKLAADSSPVIEISPCEVTAATGIDVKRIDPEEVGRRVRERLRELSLRPVVGRDSSRDPMPTLAPANPPDVAPTLTPETRN